MHQIKCAEIWGGIKNQDVDLCTCGITASLYSSACEGGKGGDIYFLSVCGQDQLTRLVLADVVGHGEPASQVSEWVYHQLAQRMNCLDQPAMLADLNTLAMDRGLKAMTTAVVMAYYMTNRHVYFSYAGHPPMLSRAGNGQWKEMALPPNQQAFNMPLGVVRETRYDMGEVQLAQGDRIFLYSDGVIEARNPQSTLFGRDRLRAALAETDNHGPLEIKAHVLDRLHSWTGGPLNHDDVTLVAIQLE